MRRRVAAKRARCTSGRLPPAEERDRAWPRRTFRAIVGAAMPRSADSADGRAVAAVKGAVPPDPISLAVTAVLAGDVGRFADIVRAFDGVVRRIVARTLRDVHALEDVVQEVWVRV